MTENQVFLNYYTQKIAEGKEDALRRFDKRKLPDFCDPSGGYALGRDSLVFVNRNPLYYTHITREDPLTFSKKEL